MLETLLYPEKIQFLNKTSEQGWSYKPVSRIHGNQKILAGSFYDKISCDTHNTAKQDIT